LARLDVEISRLSPVFVAFVIQISPRLTFKKHVLNALQNKTGHGWSGSNGFLNKVFIRSIRRIRVPSFFIDGGTAVT
jgi:hypothetical protein